MKLLSTYERGARISKIYINESKQFVVDCSVLGKTIGRFTYTGINAAEICAEDFVDLDNPSGNDTKVFLNE